MPSPPEPRVSVCIPTMSRPREFRETLQSVDRQTFREFEVVVTDNSGNPENQRAIDEVLTEFRHLPIRLVRHPKTLEVATNFNSMIDTARGEFWACLPDDDRYCPTFLARSVAALDANPECSFTFADHWIIRSDGSVDEEQSVANSTTYGRTVLPEGVVASGGLFGAVLDQSPCFQTSLFRRPVVDKFRFIPHMLTLDISLFLRLSAASLSAYYIAERLMEYRIHADQISSTTRRSDFLVSIIGAFEKIERVPPEYARRYRHKLGRLYLTLAIAEAEKGASRAAREHALKSIKVSRGAPAVLGGALAIFAPRSLPLARRLLAGLRRARPTKSGRVGDRL